MPDNNADGAGAAFNAACRVEENHRDNDEDEGDDGSAAR